MAISTRKKAFPKVSSRPKVTTRPRTSQHNPLTIQVPATPPPSTSTPDIVEHTQPDPRSNDDHTRRLIIAQELAKLVERQSNNQPQIQKPPSGGPTRREIDSVELIQRMLAEARDQRE